MIFTFIKTLAHMLKWAESKFRDVMRKTKTQITLVGVYFDYINVTVCVNSL